MVTHPNRGLLTTGPDWHQRSTLTLYQIRTPEFSPWKQATLNHFVRVGGIVVDFVSGEGSRNPRAAGTGSGAEAAEEAGGEA